METLEGGSYQNPTVEGTLYMDDVFLNDAGRIVEDNALEFLAGAFNMAELNYVIHYDLPGQSVPAATGTCDEPFQTWNARVRDGNVPHTAKDFNLLLIDRNGGGCSNHPAQHPGRVVAGVDHFAEQQWDYALEGDTPVWNNVGAMLHEVGHNLGFKHQPHGGWAFNQDGQWHRTPTVGGNDVDNDCGEYIEPRENEPSHKYAFYHWCAVSGFTLTDVPIGEIPAENAQTVSPSVPSTYPPVYNGSTVDHADMFPQPPAAMEDLYIDPATLVATDNMEDSLAVSFRVVNDAPLDVQATVSISVGDETLGREYTVPSQGSTPDETVTIDYPVDSEETRSVCVDVTTARWL